MKAKLWFASLVTLGILFSFVFTILMAFAYEGGLIGAGLMLALTVLINLVMWLVSPLIMDLVQRWVYKSRVIEIEELRANKPRVAEFVERVCQKHGIRVPKLRLIDDMNPTAFCYGSTANRSRLVVSRGLFHYLDDREASAVYGHELGHIIHRDFIVMTIAATMVQILYEIYAIAIRVRTRRGNPFLPLAIASLIFYWLGTYLLLFLSRTREYLADRFAAEEMGDPNALSMALVKIAYGIAREPDTVQAKRLLRSTRALGIYDPKAAAGIGYAYQSLEKSGAAVAVATGAAPPGEVAVALPGLRRIEKVFLFDLFNPWAKVAELGSTHPLTGKRIRALGNYCAELGQQPLFSFERIDASGREIDGGKMYGKFFFEVVIYFLPHIAGVASLVGGILYEPALFGIPLAIGLGLLCRGLYRYPGLGSAEPTTVLDLMSDPYASPLRGRPVVLEGRVIGKADAGGRFGEDMEMEDRGGGLIMLNYESPVPILGNIFFGAGKANRLIGQDVRVLGWFRRSVFHVVDLKRLEAEGMRVSSYTRFWGIFAAVLLVIAGAALAAVGVSAAAVTAPYYYQATPYQTAPAYPGYQPAPSPYPGYPPAAPPYGAPGPK
ncbi:MAG: M48 family metalloprotease [Deltaproteobacteria bacterium]|nr:M48 family metalloprotease [Deltaproteobacteria bacterium]